MLRHTFLHLPGVGAATEKKLWKAGVRTWDEARERMAGLLSPGRANLAAPLLAESAAALAEGDARWFQDRLPSEECWRVYPDFRGRAAFLDIETTGLNHGDCITTACIWDGEELRAYVRGDNLGRLADDLMGYDLLVSYNGRTFDAPFIEAEFDVRFPQAHLDLRYPLKKVGLSGGLKRIEQALGIGRGDVTGMDGYFAVLLWKEYEDSGDPRVLETLLAYNAADAANLERLAVHAVNALLAKTPFAADCALPVPRPPDLGLTAHQSAVERVRRRFGV
ncbi:MAG: ribonuclease H-like domain-containing protein [Thermodesulfobacteriota bacterium]